MHAATETLIGLVVGGLVLLLAEVFVPGGVLGAIGGVLMLLGIIGGFLQSRVLGLELLVGSLVGGLLAFWIWLKYFPRSPVGRRLILDTSEEDWQGYDQSFGDLVGKTGVSHTTLRPAGIAVIDGRRVNVVTQGEMVRRGKRVRVVEAEGNRIVVEEIRSDAPSESTAPGGVENDAGESGPTQNRES